MKPHPLKERKARLRNKLRNILKQIRTSENRRRSAKIGRRVRRHPAYLDAERILAFSGIPGEVETRRLICDMIRDGKRVYLPVTDVNSDGLSLYRIRDIERDTRTGLYGILEPRRIRRRRGFAREMDLILVPGLGFDRRGRRLGRGGGWFDRLLVQAPQACKVAIAFREQICRCIPVEAHDVSVDEVLTDEDERK